MKRPKINQKEAGNILFKKRYNICQHWWEKKFYSIGPWMTLMSIAAVVVGVVSSVEPVTSDTDRPLPLAVIVVDVATLTEPSCCTE